MAEQTQAVVHKRQLTGVVTGSTENKTIHVSVQTRKTNSIYRKQFNARKQYAAHDEKNTAQVGDTVVIEACRPYSKTKKWRLVRVISSQRS